MQIRQPLHRDDKTARLDSSPSQIPLCLLSSVTPIVLSSFVPTSTSANHACKSCLCRPIVAACEDNRRFLALVRIPPLCPQICPSIAPYHCPDICTCAMHWLVVHPGANRVVVEEHAVTPSPPAKPSPPPLCSCSLLAADEPLAYVATADQSLSRPANANPFVAGSQQQTTPTNGANAASGSFTFTTNITPVTFSGADASDVQPDKRKAKKRKLSEEDHVAEYFTPAMPIRKEDPPRKNEGHIPRPPNAFILFRSDLVQRKAVPASLEAGASFVASDDPLADY